MIEVNTLTELDQLVDSSKLILIDFYADWCGPCQTLMPIIDQLSEMYPDDLEVLKINIDNAKSIASEFQIRSVPTLIFIKNRKALERLGGVQTMSYLRSRIKEYNSAN